MIINWLTFYLSWWGIAYFASSENYLICLLILLIHLAFHFLLVVKKERMLELIFIIKISLIGFFVDFLLHQINILKLNKNFYVWGIFIWIIFSTTLRHSLLKIFNLQKWVVFILFFIFGPFSYFVVQKFNLVNYPNDVLKNLLHAMFWGFFSLFIKFYLESNNEICKND